LRSTLIVWQKTFEIVREAIGYKQLIMPRNITSSKEKGNAFMQIRLDILI